MAKSTDHQKVSRCSDKLILYELGRVNYLNPDMNASRIVDYRYLIVTVDPIARQQKGN